MLRSFLLGFGLFCLTATQAQTIPTIKLKAEPKFAVNIHGGYAWALGSTFKFYPDDIRSIRMVMSDNNIVSKSVKYGSPKRGLGEGFRTGAGISYVLNDFINVGLDLDYFRSTINKTKDSSFQQTFTSGQITSKSYDENSVISYDATLLTFTPHIVIKAVSRPKWFLYNKVGMVITVRPNSIQHDKRQVKTSMTSQGFVKDSAAATDTRYSWGIKNPSIGFMGSVGAQWKLTERLRVYGELQFSHIVFVIRKRTTTNLVINGKDMIGSLSVNEKEIDFETDFRQDTWIPDPNKPAKAVTQRIPITFVGLQAGLSYRF